MPERTVRGKGISVELRQSHDPARARQLWALLFPDDVPQATPETNRPPTARHAEGGRIQNEEDEDAASDAPQSAE